MEAQERHHENESRFLPEIEIQFVSDIEAPNFCEQKLVLLTPGVCYIDASIDYHICKVVVYADNDRVINYRLTKTDKKEIAEFLQSEFDPMDFNQPWLYDNGKATSKFTL